MVYYRCKCGRREAWGSMGPSACTRCPECKSDLATGPDSHADPQPHQYVTRYNETTGAPYERCERCGERKSELEKRGEA